MPILEGYVREFVALRGKTVPETSYYALLQNILDDVGRALNPRIKAVIHPKNTGVGIPDLALFDENQPDEQKPAHGVVEAKPTNDDLMTIAQSRQVVEQYLPHYGQVLVTNYYQFVLVTRGEDGKAVIEERYDLTENEAAFWEAAAHPKRLADQHESALREYLMRVMRRNAPLTTPQDVAWILASYAREAKARIATGKADLQTLTTIRQQLEAALGVKFEGETADEFFRSTLVQTLFYGLFSAWVLWHERHPALDAKFELFTDTRRLTIPVLRELFDQFSSSSNLPRSVEEVLQWTADALNRVDRAAFFERFIPGAAVQYFYEPFLEAFDPQLRQQLGVWYTPMEVVEYMVARVDAALKDELGIADGLADPSVYVLDPCCGTGAYLVAVLRHIHQSLKKREGDAMASQMTAQAVRERIFGFEILPAPFVVSHLQLGMLLNSFDVPAPLQADQRAGVYLTNALTGWKEHDQKPLDFPELQRERDAAEGVKQRRPILVILGNPPYYGRAAPPPFKINEERELTDAYRIGKDPRLPEPEGQGLNDLYVRFYRMAERRIVEQTGRGIICFISNYSWLDGQSHPAMRERYLEVFDTIYVDNLHGDRIISEYATDGNTSENVFTVRGSSPGIRLGTAITTLIAKPASPDETKQANLYYRDMNQARADARRAALLESLKTPHFKDHYVALKPAIEIGIPFKPRTFGVDYISWPLLNDLFPVSFPGVKTSRDNVLVDVDEDRLVARMKQYFDPVVSHDDLRRTAPAFMRSFSERYNAESVRDILRKRGFLPGNIVRYSYRPFDTRWLYWDPETKLLDEKRADYFPNIQLGNMFLFTTARIRKNLIEAPIFVRQLNDLNSMDSGARGFPLYLYDTKKDATLFDGEVSASRKANLTEKARTYLESIEANESALFYHTLAVLHSLAYRSEHAGALKQDWPRVPLPPNREVLMKSAALGQQVAALMDTETPIPGITQGDPRPELAAIALVITDGGAPNFAVTAHWGRQQGGIVMPGTGRLITHEDGAIDVYLNETTFWKHIPKAVWEYTLGGYPVLKKWLSYRETSVLGRSLKPEEAREFTHIARRIAALLALNEALDANYRTVTSRALHLEHE